MTPRTECSGSLVFDVTTRAGDTRETWANRSTPPPCLWGSPTPRAQGCSVTTGYSTPVALGCPSEGVGGLGDISSEG